MDNKNIVINFFEEVYNQKRLDYFDRYYAENYYEHQPTGARTNQMAKEIVSGAFSTFSNLSVTVDDVVCEGDLVAARVHFYATHTGEFIGVLPTNKKLDWEAMEFFKLKDDKIIESWGSWPLYEIINKMK